MIPAVAQTLAEILAEGTSLISAEQIDFNHPGLRQDSGPRLNLYCYDLRANSRMRRSLGLLESRNTHDKPAATLAKPSTVWFDVSFLVSAWDDTALGEQRLLSEALMLLLSHRAIEEKLLAPALRGYGNLPMTVSTLHCIDTAALWSALGVPLRPALYVTVTIPVHLRGATPTPTQYFRGGFTNPDPIKATF